MDKDAEEWLFRKVSTKFDAKKTFILRRWMSQFGFLDHWHFLDDIISFCHVFLSFFTAESLSPAKETSQFL